jgi:hypothetical protein
MAGYAGSPLAKKLGLRADMCLLPVDAPTEYSVWLAPLPDGVILVESAPKGGCDAVHLFVARLAELDRHFPAARRAMKTGGMLWVSWYKKSSKMPTDVTETIVRRRGLASDLVDVKVCAVTELWSGLKFVVRRHLR